MKNLRGYISYNYVSETEYNERGDVISIAVSDPNYSRFESETDLNGYETNFGEYTYSGYEYFYIGE